MPKPLLPKPGSAIDMLMHGSKWKHQFARISFPILVQWAEQERIDQARHDEEHTYKDLAIAVGQPTQWRNISQSLVAVGKAIKQINKPHAALFPEEVSPIEHPWCGRRE